jgi:hypothetical protein
MKRFSGAAAALAAVALQGCLASNLVLHVAPDGHGRATVTTRAFESSFRALDGLFGQPAPSPPEPIEDQLTAPTERALEQAFGTRVRLASTSVEKVTDGALRTTVVDFDDVTKLQLTFPPLLDLSSGDWHMSVGGLSDRALITFAMTPHENGDRLLLVRMPQNRLEPDAEPHAVKVRTAAEEEEDRQIKRAYKGMAVRLFVELDDETPILRTNAPAQSGNRATILDLDLEKVIDNFGDDMMQSAMTPGSMQELLWQLHDMPGALVPADREVFLEFEPPRQQPPAQPARPAPAAPQAPPDTEIYLAPMKTANGAIEIGTPVNITNSPGYDNQPFFTPNGASVLFTSIRGGAGSSTGRGGAAQTDIYRYDIASKQTTRVTSTPESEYSPTVMPDGKRISVIRVEADGTQRLWSVSPDGAKPGDEVVLKDVKPVGYHAWAGDRTLALFILGSGQGQPATLQVADTRTGTAKVVGTDIGRSLQRIPGRQGPPLVSFVQREHHGDMIHLVVKALNPATGEASTLTPAVEGAAEADLAWTPDGTLLMAKEGVLYGWKQGQSGWKEVASLERLSLRGVTRLAVSPKGDYIACVGSPQRR